MFIVGHELIKFLLNVGCPYVLTERSCQDTLEIILVANDPWDTEKIILLLETLAIMITRLELKKYLDQSQETVVMMTKN